MLIRSLLFKELLKQSSGGIFVLHYHVYVGCFQQVLSTHHFVRRGGLGRLDLSGGWKISSEELIEVFSCCTSTTWWFFKVRIRSRTRSISMIIIIYHISKNLVLESHIIRLTSIIGFIEKRLIRMLMNIKIALKLSGIYLGITFFYLPCVLD